ncbi:MAG: hypothetical protein EOO68_07515 [Moraxellaceae bacterium]|nr:MAG: hypothetical protein EOO68_07515 [Moraxellaceae bacterium]
MVIVIIGLSVGIVTLSIAPSQDDSLSRKEAQSLMQAIEFVSEQAVLNGNVMAMFLTPKNSEESLGKQWCYTWKIFRENSWTEMPEDSLTEHCMPENLQWDLVVEGRIYSYDPDLETQPPVLVFAPSGESTPVEMAIFEQGSDSEAQRIEIDLMGTIIWRNEEEAEKRNGLKEK